MIPNQVILIGGGASLKPYLPKLKEKLKGKFVIGLNFSYKFIDSTFTTFVDYNTFYNKYKEDFNHLPLLIGAKHQQDVKQTNNLLTLKPSNKYDRNLKNGIYFRSLCGAFSLSLAIYLIEKGNIFLCYDDKTEVFTNEGWKYFEKLNGEELILTRKSNGVAEWSKIKAQQKYKYNGKMFLLQQRGIDFCVTPDHRFCLENKKNNDYVWKTIPEFKTTPGYYIPKTFIWKGKKQKYFNLPSVDLYRGHKKTGIKKIKMENWCAFLGLYLAEGCVAYPPNSDYKIVIYQNHNKKNDKFIKKILNKIKINYHWHKRGWVIYGKQLTCYLKQFGTSKDKFIPREILNLDKKYLKVLLNSLIFGDGNKNKTGGFSYWSVSKKLADNVQEAAYKCGYYAEIYSRKGRKSPYSNKIGKKVWQVWANNSKKQGNLAKISICNLKSKNKMKTVNYDGFVYDVTVEKNHTLFVRRNNKCCWSSNCGYDFGCINKKIKIDNRRETHWYQDKFIHRGTGKYSYYEISNKAHKIFGCFRDLKNINIYNVSPESHLHEFPKISYEDFFNMISYRKHNQNKLRRSVKEKVKKLTIC